MSTQVLNIPDLGEAEDIEVIEICVKVGDIVSAEDPIIVLESDKAAMEIPTSLGGKVLAIKVSIGDKVSAGSPFLEIESEEKSHLMMLRSQLWILQRPRKFLRPLAR